MPFYLKIIDKRFKRLNKILILQRCPDQFTLLKQNVKHGLKTLATREEFKPVSLVFMDPPYRLLRNYP